MLQMHTRMNEKLLEIIQVSGADRIAFLQGQFTQDIKLLSSSKILFGALCNPKGRVFATCQLFATKDRVNIILPTSMIDHVIKRLNLYKLRSDVCIERNKHIQSFCIQYTDSASSFSESVHDNQELGNAYVSHQLKRTNDIEFFIYENNSDSNTTKPITHLNNDQWKAARIANGIVDVVPDTSEKYTPHMLNLDIMKGISFDKGCYIGQEIVARTEFIGKVKRRAVSYSLSSKINSRDEKFYLGEDTIGIDILSISAEMMIALVNTSIASKKLTYKRGIATPINTE